MENNEIIKVLQYCRDGQPCSGCDFYEKCYDFMHSRELLRGALKIIEEQGGIIEDYKVMSMMRNGRTYYSKFIEDVWKKEHGELSEPDFDEIYRRYFEQQEIIEGLNKKIAYYDFDRICHNVSELNLLLEMYNVHELKKRFRAEFEEKIKLGLNECIDWANCLDTIADELFQEAKGGAADDR